MCEAALSLTGFLELRFLLGTELRPIRERGPATAGPTPQVPAVPAAACFSR
jgi:hypothetical protein